MNSEPPAAWPPRQIPKPRRASVVALAGVFVLYVLLACFWQLVYPRQPEMWFPPVAWLWEATDGLINATFTANVVNQLIIVGVFLFGLCRIRPSEIGLDLTKLPAALCLTAVCWVVGQAVLVLILAVSRQPIMLNPEWTSTDWPRAAGPWIGQLLGNTPLEEVVFRGFLLPQCILLMLSWMPTARPGMQIAAALVLSQGLFTVPHVLLNLRLPQGQWLLIAQFVMGLAFAGIYLRTGNLFLAMGVHTLANNPSPLIKDPIGDVGLGGGIIMLGTLLAVIFGPRVAKVARHWTGGLIPES
jgi:membrane protease YdiL (CAAX protease family)